MYTAAIDIVGYIKLIHIHCNTVSTIYLSYFICPSDKIADETVCYKMHLTWPLYIAAALHLSIIVDQFSFNWPFQLHVTLYSLFIRPSDKITGEIVTQSEMDLTWPL